MQIALYGLVFFIGFILGAARERHLNKSEIDKAIKDLKDAVELLKNKC